MAKTRTVPTPVTRSRGSDSILDCVAALPTELRNVLFSYLHPNLQTLCLAGHIICRESIVISLPKNLSVDVFAVGSGGAARVSYRVIKPKLILTYIIFQWAGGGGSGYLAQGRLLVPDSCEISVTIGRGEQNGMNGGETVVEAGQQRLIAAGGKRGGGGQGGGWSGGGGSGAEGGRGGNNGGDGHSGTGIGVWLELAERGGQGSRVVLPHIPSLTLTPGRPGEPDQMWGGGGGGVIVNGEPEWVDQRCGEGYGAGGGGGEEFGASGIVIFYVTS